MIIFWYNTLMIMNWTKNRPKVAKKLQLCMGSILVFNLNGLKFNIDPNFSKKNEVDKFLQSSDELDWVFW